MVVCRVEPFRETDHAGRGEWGSRRARGDYAGAGFVSPLSAIIIGGVAGIVCFYAVVMKSRLRYDDSLDVVGVHGVGGTWGALATGLFASTAVNAGG